MLNIYFGYDENANDVPDIFFNHVYEDGWFDDPFVREMILDVDKSEVIGPNLSDRNQKLILNSIEWYKNC